MLLQNGIPVSSLRLWTDQKPPSKRSEEIVVTMKLVRNVLKNESNFDIFPLAAIFGTPHISP